jgi:hypothetical protein
MLEHPDCVIANPIAIATDKRPPSAFIVEP